MPLPQEGDRAPDVALLDWRGEPRRLSSYWRDGPAVVAFLRHYG